MAKLLKRVIASNVRRLMDSRPDLDSTQKIAAKAVYRRGSKKGESPTTRTIQNLLKPGEDDGPSPTIDLIEAIAFCFEVPLGIVVRLDGRTISHTAQDSHEPDRAQIAL